MKVKFEFLQTTTPDAAQLEGIFNLWNAEYPVKIKHESIDDTRKFLSPLGDQQHTFVLNVDSTIVGWFCVFTRDDARWFVIILHSSIHGEGVGSQLIARAKENEPELFGWVSESEGEIKSDGSIYRIPLDFYIKNGFETLEERPDIEGFSGLKIRWRRG